VGNGAAVSWLALIEADGMRFELLGLLANFRNESEEADPSKTIN
jgi:hypothetical protein